MNDKETLKSLIPQEILDIAKRMDADDPSGLLHTFWQVRVKKSFPAPDFYTDKWVLFDEDGEVFESWKVGDFNEFLCEKYEIDHLDWDGDCVEDLKNKHENIPEYLNKIHYQEIEIVEATHLTKISAERFIEKKQPFYTNKLYIHQESAYWSPDLKAVQDFLKELVK